MIRKLSVLAVALMLAGCVTPPEVKEKVQLEVAIHEGYGRIIRTKPDLSKEDLIKMVEASKRGWQGLDHLVNDGPAPEPAN